MATSAFKSSTRRTSGIVGPDDAASSTRDPPSHRRSRSLGGVPPPDDLLPPTQAPPTRGKFVNTERGSGFPEVRLDDLVDEFFSVKDWEEELERGRDWDGGSRRGRRLSGFAMETESSKLRGRSVSSRSVDGGRAGSKGNNGGRRKRSVIVARRNVVGDAEDHTDISRKSGSQKAKQGTNSSNDVLQRSMRHRDLPNSHDSYSSQSSSLTDDEARSVDSVKNRHVKTIRAVYADKTDHPIVDGEVNGLYQAMRKEVRDAVDDIRTELEKLMLNTKPSMIINSDDIQAEGSNVIKVIDEIKRNYASKLEESERRKQKLIADLAAEDYCGQELTNIVKGLFPEAERNIMQEGPSWDRKSIDKAMISNGLIEEAEKYFEDFLLNVEDTDISSFDGEKSDTSSTLGGSIKSKECIVHPALIESEEYLTEDVPTGENDVVLPWLQWETKNDGSLTSGKNSDDTLQIGDKAEISSGLIEEAEKHFEDFLLNVEDTDISTFEGEKSDTSSTVGSSIKYKECLVHPTLVESQEYIAEDVPVAENDGVVLPWLQSETKNDGSLSDNKRFMNILNDMVQESTSVHDYSCNASPGSCNNRSDGSSIHGKKNDAQSEGGGSSSSSFSCGYDAVGKNRCYSFDMREYISRQQDEDLLFEIQRQRQRIDSGSLIFCRRRVGSHPF